MGTKWGYVPKTTSGRGDARDAETKSRARAQIQRTPPRTLTDEQVFAGGRRFAPDEEKPRGNKPSQKPGAASNKPAAQTPKTMKKPGQDGKGTARKGRKKQK